MAQQTLAPILGALDECIETYTTERKMCVDEFINQHFSLAETLEIQKRSVPWDFLLTPINALWSIPYVSLKKSIETADKMGWTKLSPLIERVPSGFKTGYQKSMEKLLLEELIQPEKLLKRLHEHPVIGPQLASHQVQLNEKQIRKEMIKEIEKHTSGQAMISDLCSSLLALLAGWIYFGDKNLGVLDLGSRIAKKMAREKAASGFFLGEKLGHTFYGYFPPAPTKTQVVLATVAVGCVLTVISVLVSTMSDPLRKKMGLHHRKLTGLVESLEEKLFLQIKKEIKTSLQQSELLERAGS
ncbi:DUF6635 family protein [Bdellovibrio sp. HCB2-146]|uniref:DUF6635 family protein n=1 Tax=Bdellovibrio sp. HCB2-146 TaxID=3394362 RepID=UPI0039BC992C